MDVGTRRVRGKNPQKNLTGAPAASGIATISAMPMAKPMSRAGIASMVQGAWRRSKRCAAVEQAGRDQHPEIRLEGEVLRRRHGDEHGAGGQAGERHVGKVDAIGRHAGPHSVCYPAAMMKREAIPIAAIYVPVKRRASLEQAKVATIAESMLKDGQQTPILVRPDGARFVLIEGLHRLEAARALGETTIFGFRVDARKH